MTTWHSSQVPGGWALQVRLDDAETENRMWFAGMGSQVLWFEKARIKKERKQICCAQEQKDRALLDQLLFGTRVLAASG